MSSLGIEIKQAKPFTSVEEEVFLSVVRTAARLERAAAEALKPFGLTTTQYNVLRILRGAGNAGLCRNEVGARMLTPVPDTTRLLDRLVGMGLVVRDRDADDRRFVTTRITSAGTALLARIDAPVTSMHREVLGHMTRSKLRLTVELLEEARLHLPQ